MAIISLSRSATTTCDQSMGGGGVGQWKHVLPQDFAISKEVTFLSSGRPFEGKVSVKRRAPRR